MPTRKTFHPTGGDHVRRPEAVPYYPIVIAQPGVPTLALHRSADAPSTPETSRPWVVSEPVSGARVVLLTATYRGVPVSSSCFTAKQAREVALLEVESLIARVGLERFIAQVATVRAQVAAANPVTA